MKRWHIESMLEIGTILFTKIYRRKRLMHHNHGVHFLARQFDAWFISGVNALASGTYTPRHLKRRYFQDEVIDQLHLSDRIFQHILLKQLKTTFPFVMNKNCYHLHGPTGVKYATKRLRHVLQTEEINYFIRADIKSFYRSIPHFKLIQDIKKYYDDIRLQNMLTNIISTRQSSP